MMNKSKRRSSRGSKTRRTGQPVKLMKLNGAKMKGQGNDTNKNEYAMKGNIECRRPLQEILKRSETCWLKPVVRNKLIRQSFVR